jgi:hypothetical protein
MVSAEGGSQGGLPDNHARSAGGAAQENIMYQPARKPNPAVPMKHPARRCAKELLHSDTLGTLESAGKV